MQNWWAVAADGFGVAMVGWLGKLFYDRFKKEKDTSGQSIVNSTVTGSTVAGRDINIGQLHVSQQFSTPSAAEEEYHQHPTPEEMRAEIGKVSMYARPDVARTYKGLKVRWTGKLYSIHPREETRTEFAAKIGAGMVGGVVNIDDCPILKTVRGGEPLTITGTVEHVEVNGFVTLKDAKLRFHPAQTPEPTSSLTTPPSTADPRKISNGSIVRVLSDGALSTWMGKIVEIRESPGSEPVYFVEFGGDAATRRWFKGSELVMDEDERPTRDEPQEGRFNRPRFKGRF